MVSGPFKGIALIYFVVEYIHMSFEKILECISTYLNSRFFFFFFKSLSLYTRDCISQYVFNLRMLLFGCGENTELETYPLTDFLSV